MNDRFDEAVDRAVRDMLDVEPPADLRARVMARLPVDGSRHGAVGFRLAASGWVLTSFAAAAVILLAVFVARRSEPPAPGVAHGPDIHLATPAVAPPEPGRPDPRRPSVTRPSGAAASRTAGAPAPATIVAVNAPDEAFSTNIAPLTPLPPIAMSPIGEHSIAPAEIAVRPLNAIADVQIAPLTPPDRR